MLERHGAALCIHDLLADHPWERTTDWTYVRFHGPERARARSTRAATAAAASGGWPTGSATWLDEGCDVYAYFNNDYDGHAVADARWLRGPAHAGAGRHLLASRARGRSATRGPAR